MVEWRTKPDLAVLMNNKLKMRRTIVKIEASGFNFNPNKPIIVICISVTAIKMY